MDSCLIRLELIGRDLEKTKGLKLKYGLLIGGRIGGRLKAMSIGFGWMSCKLDTNVCFE
ncbi:MAG: hypothetical protein ACKESC_01515 [Candidatus Hodgkinia cicadicola]